MRFYIAPNCNASHSTATALQRAALYCTCKAHTHANAHAKHPRKAHTHAISMRMLPPVAQATDVGAAAPWRRSPLTHLDALRAIRERGKPINALLQLPFFNTRLLSHGLATCRRPRCRGGVGRQLFLVCPTISCGAHHCAASCSAERQAARVVRRAWHSRPDRQAPRERFLGIAQTEVQRSLHASSGALPRRVGRRVAGRRRRCRACSQALL